ncbi:hypothetical protein U0C82_17695 [Fulvimarina sp. 2208YS6-2-32]|uniref:Cell division and transport-associated protein TolA n=1 Tax=Fulvimarina uroteuthidis TaxID=3098149 RepID=A0ABU5I6G0_9HYPH|nr:hypothetical protein [Fulvimarina sp. 2208YS6-2-32]MDY8110969.1 hypothetical protein [Fulvimarina sp. 2208YS6-2-32]
MKTGVVVSSLAHGVLLTWGLWALGAPEPMTIVDDSLPVELVSIEEFSQSMRGAQDAPIAETSAPEPTEDRSEPVPDAENAGENSVDLDAAPAPRPAPRETVQTAAAEPSPEPVMPDPVPAPEPEPAAEPEPVPAPEPEPAEAEAEPAPQPEPDPVSEAIEQAVAEPEPDPVPSPPRNVPVPSTKPRPPERVEVAEARREPPPTEPEQTEKPEQPKQEAAEEKTFDADQIAALLNREQSAGGGAKRETETAALGGRQTTGATLAASEIDALRRATKECWNEPSGSFGAEGIVVELSFELEPDGSLSSPPRATATGGDPATRRAYEGSASRAVRICAQQGRYRLSAESYDAWSELTFNFRPDVTY